MRKLTPEKYNLEMDKMLKRLKGCPIHEILIALLDFAHGVEIISKPKGKKK